MATATAHYERLLAEHYTWMTGGDVQASALAQAELLSALGVHSQSEHDIAIDLGCGPGAQTLALISHGFSPVIAVDTSRKLLDELLESAPAAATIYAVHEDIRGVLPQAVESGTAAAIVCMGDTLPHLPSKADVSALFHDIARALKPGGHMVATYRDLTQELHGADRFIPVRSTDRQLLTCFLEYGDDSVMVHDLLHIRVGEEWELRTSSYPKLRLAPSWLAQQCRTAGLKIRHDEVGQGGMRILHAVKP